MTLTFTNGSQLYAKRGPFNTQYANAEVDVDAGSSERCLQLIRHNLEKLFLEKFFHEMSKKSFEAKGKKKNGRLKRLFR